MLKAIAAKNNELHTTIKNLKDKRGNPVNYVTPQGWGTICRVTSDNGTGKVDSIERFPSPHDAIFATNYIRWLEKDFGHVVDER